MSSHHPQDGCTGEDRPMSPADHDAIGDRMGEMMLAIARRDGHSVLRAGAWIGVHYGPGGEYALAVRLAMQVVGLAPLEHCDATGAPVLDKALGREDDRVLLLTAHCISQFPETRQHTSEEIVLASTACRPMVERFVDHCKHARSADALATWEAMYEMTHPGTEATRDNTLRAGACSALLTTWAARYSTTRIDA